MSNLNLFQRLVKVQSSLGVMEKTGFNAKFGFKYIEHGEIKQAVRKLFAEHGVSFWVEQPALPIQTPITGAKNGQIETKGWHSLVSLRIHLANIDKPDERIAVDWSGESIDSFDKGVGKAIVLGVKYWLIESFMIPGTDDPDGAQGLPERNNGPQKQPNRRTATPAPAPSPHTPPAKSKGVPSIEDLNKAIRTAPDDIERLDKKLIPEWENRCRASGAKPEHTQKGLNLLQAARDAAVAKALGAPAAEGDEPLPEEEGLPQGYPLAGEIPLEEESNGPQTL